MYVLYFIDFSLSYISDLKLWYQYYTISVRKTFTEVLNIAPLNSI